MNDETAPKRPNVSDHFAKMAERIRHNADSTFGGAFVLVPPGPDGTPIQALILNSNESLVQFYSWAKVEIQMRLDEMQNQERQIAGFNRR